MSQMWRPRPAVVSTCLLDCFLRQDSRCGGEIRINVVIVLLTAKI